MRKIIDLSSSGGKRVFDRDLDMSVPSVVRWRGKLDVDLEARTVTVLVTRRDTAPGDAVIVFLQPPASG